MVITVIKTITDLERIGDEAQKVARMGKLILLADRVHMPRFREIQKMAEVALSMLRRALDAFARLDVAGALDVTRQDRKLDDEFDANFRQLVTFMMEDPRAISMSIDTIFMCKAIERIGDHAKNISGIRGVPGQGQGYSPYRTGRRRAHRSVMLQAPDCACSGRPFCGRLFVHTGFPLS